MRPYTTAAILAFLLLCSAGCGGDAQSPTGGVQAVKLSRGGEFVAAPAPSKPPSAFKGTKILEPDPRVTAASLDSMADMYEKLGDKAKADDMRAQAAKIRAQPR
ncbi:MAG: hypothetical protein WCK05_01960 [Planctomycetota bacterium]